MFTAEVLISLLVAAGVTGIYVRNGPNGYHEPNTEIWNWDRTWLVATSCKALKAQPRTLQKAKIVTAGVGHIINHGSYSLLAQHQLAFL